MTNDCCNLAGEFWDEIESIEYIGEIKTIDINTTGNRLFYANGILTHNSAVDELDFNHSHISGGISKINTADNVFGILSTMATREKGLYQLQAMKTRSSAGLGKKLDLGYCVDSMRISNLSEEQKRVIPQSGPGSAIMQKVKGSGTPFNTSPTRQVDRDTGEILTDTATADLLKRMASFNPQKR